MVSQAQAEYWTWGEVETSEVTMEAELVTTPDWSGGFSLVSVSTMAMAVAV